MTVQEVPLTHQVEFCGAWQSMLRSQRHDAVLQEGTRYHQIAKMSSHDQSREESTST
jgi:hypothetical protein